MTCLRKYADFNGRAGRAEFWWFVLAYVVADVVLNIVGSLIHVPIITILMLGVLVPYIAVAVRRLHDTNRSGWWYLIAFTGIGVIFLIIWWAAEGTVGDNKFGPDPRGTTGATPPTPESSWAN